jgi:ADP-dependent NAD(P)H-hydrate dehydratase / NAD(P)H-hydrate epimerase
VGVLAFPLDGEMILATSGQMREIDRIAIHELGVRGEELMERAGSEVAAAIIEEFGPIEGKRVVVVAGKGNNGGDGFVVARHMLEAGAAPRIALVGSRADVRGDAAGALARADAAGVPVSVIEGDERAWGTVRATVSDALAGADLVVDALLGTGAAGAPRGAIAEAIAALEASGQARPSRPVIAIDIPSGIDADTGAAPGLAVHAALTVTLALAKPGLFLYPGRSHAGRLRVAAIGIPATAVERVALDTRLYADAERGALQLPARAPDAHKRQVGSVLVAGASPGLTGSVFLAGMAALRSGAGLVTLAVPRSVQAILAAKATEIMTLELSDTKSHCLGSPAARELLDAAERFDVLALGPGLGRGAESRAFASEVLEGWRGPVVVDADALWVLANGLARLRAAAEGGGRAGAGQGADVVVTPHAGEAERLTGESREAIAADRIAFARRSAIAMAGTFLLKGNPTIIADKSGVVTLNITGNCGMATAGAGDVLTGLIAGLIAQGMGGAEAARAGAWLHGRAGDLAAGARGFRSLIAGDILEFLPQAIREVDERAG